MKRAGSIISKLLILLIIVCGNSFNLNAQDNEGQTFESDVWFDLTLEKGGKQVTRPTDGKYGYNISGDGQVSFKMGQEENDGGKVRAVSGFMTRVTIYNKNTNQIIYNNNAYYMEGIQVSIPTYLTRGNYIVEVEYEGCVFEGEFSHDH